MSLQTCVISRWINSSFGISKWRDPPFSSWTAGGTKPLRTRWEMLYRNNVRIPDEKMEEESQTHLVFEEKQSFKLIGLDAQESVVPKNSLSW